MVQRPMQYNRMLSYYGSADLKQGQTEVSDVYNTYCINHFCYKVKLSLVFMTSSNSKKQTKTTARNKITKQQLSKQNMFCTDLRGFLFLGEAWSEKILHRNMNVTVHILAVKTQRGAPGRPNEAEPGEEVQAVYLSLSDLIVGAGLRCRAVT